MTKATRNVVELLQELHVSTSQKTATFEDLSFDRFLNFLLRKKYWTVVEEHAREVYKTKFLIFPDDWRKISMAEDRLF